MRVCVDGVIMRGQFVIVSIITNARPESVDRWMDSFIVHALFHFSAIFSCPIDRGLLPFLLPPWPCSRFSFVFGFTTTLLIKHDCAALNIALSTFPSISSIKLGSEVKGRAPTSPRPSSFLLGCCLVAPIITTRHSPTWPLLKCIDNGDALGFFTWLF